MTLVLLLAACSDPQAQPDSSSEPPIDPPTVQATPTDDASPEGWSASPPNGPTTQVSADAALLASSCAAGLELIDDATERQLVVEVMARLKRGEAPRTRKDDTTYRNAKQLLPAKPFGYYRRYVVPQPGAPRLGERRLVAGRNGELWYTPDHYGHFTRVDQPAGCAKIPLR